MSVGPTATVLTLIRRAPFSLMHLSVRVRLNDPGKMNRNFQVELRIGFRLAGNADALLGRALRASARDPSVRKSRGRPVRFAPRFYSLETVNLPVSSIENSGARTWKSCENALTRKP